MTNKIYHNPRCSKSRQTLALLEEKGVEVEIIKYLDNPPSTDEIAAMIKGLGLTSARQMMRTKEAEYKAQNLADASISEDQLIQAMHDTPKLIERPIVEYQGRFAMGRPPENVLEIL